MAARKRPGPRPMGLPMRPGGLLRLPPEQYPELRPRELEVLEAILGFFGQVRAQRLRDYLVPERMPPGPFYAAIHRLEDLRFIRPIGTRRERSYVPTRLHVVPLDRRDAVRRSLRSDTHPTDAKGREEPNQRRPARPHPRPKWNDR